MRIVFVTLMGDLIEAAFSTSILGRAVSSGIMTSEVIDPRDYCYDRHGKVDERPYGGAPGMLMKAEPVALALENALATGPALLIAPDPTGPKFTQSDAREWSREKTLVFVCGHYEGIDERLFSAFPIQKVSLGDFVLTNGAAAALVMADATVRQIPGVLGNEGSLESDSFGTSGGLAAPNYTRPPVWRGHAVPSILLSGDHAKVQAFQRHEGREITAQVRPDLIEE
ncbi:tRNA (guanosine(37)-N1)-methyltransferase TrmD [soil metagenome]